MKCPYCGINFHENVITTAVTAPGYTLGKLVIDSQTCPSCNKSILQMRSAEDFHNFGGDYVSINELDRRVIWPITLSSRMPPIEVPADIAEDYSEAAAIFSLSPKASAALSRRCLQAVFHNVGIKKKNLHDEIEFAIEDSNLPTHIKESLNAFRQIGNMAAHPWKNTHTGEIINVEPNEAEWILDILDILFDQYFVQPAKAMEMRQKISKRLEEAGKKPLPNLD